MVNKATTTDTALSCDFINTLFEHTKQSIYVSTLANKENDKTHGERYVITRVETEIADFVKHYDIPMRAIYFCVGTISAEGSKIGTRNKDTIAELPFLHVDIDFKDINDTPDAVLRKIRALEFPPSCIEATGHGYHLYWYLTKAYLLPTDDTRQEAIGRFETVLKLLCDLLGGDTLVTHVAALMRVPGSHNTKNGEWTQVCDIESNGRSFEFDDIEEWTTRVSPIILRNLRPRSTNNAEDNPWLRTAKEFGFGTPVDVEERLRLMDYMAGRENGIHATQLAVTASMALAGRDVEEIVDLVKKATTVAAGKDGDHWDWRREEKKIRRMIADALKKQKAGKMGASRGKQHTGTNNEEVVIDLASKRQEREKAKQNTAKENKAKREAKLSMYALIGSTVLGAMWERGVRLLTTSDQLWRCDNGLWSLMEVGARQSIEVEIERCCENLKINTEIRLVAEVRAWIMRRPSLRHDKIAWDAHGKIPTKSGLIDPKTLKLEPLTPEHYATWGLDVEYDSVAKCPWWELALQDMLADRPEDVRSQYVGLLQEMLGVALLDDKPKALTKALILVGDSNSGKTTALEVMSGLLTDNPIATSLETLGGPHGMMEFVRRAPWVLHEAFDGGKWHPSARFKSIISGDPVDINIKNGPIISKRITQPIYFGSNLPLQIREPTNAVRNRVIIINCLQEFNPEKLIGAGAEAERLGFEKPWQMILKNEKAGLLNFALAGMQRAMKRGNFEKIAEVEETLEEFRIESNLAASFLKECCKFGPDNRIRVADFCAAFSTHWVQNKSGDQPVPGNDAIMRAVKLFGDKRVAVGNDLRDNTYRYMCGPHLTASGIKYWEIALMADRFTGKQASKVAHTSSAYTEVNRSIPPAWGTKEAIKRFRRADFSLKSEIDEGENEAEDGG
jgi:phage/plasmid-associated DNA primase